MTLRVQLAKLVREMAEEWQSRHPHEPKKLPKRRTKWFGMTADRK